MSSEIPLQVFLRSNLAQPINISYSRHHKSNRIEIISFFTCDGILVLTVNVFCSSYETFWTLAYLPSSCLLCWTFKNTGVQSIPKRLTEQILVKALISLMSAYRHNHVKFLHLCWNINEPKWHKNTTFSWTPIRPQNDWHTFRVKFTIIGCLKYQCLKTIREF